MRHISFYVLLLLLAVSARGAESFSSVLDSAGNTSNDNISAGGGSGIEIIAGKDSNQASLKLAKSRPNSITSLIISTPIGDSSDNNIATLDGLASTNRITINHKFTQFGEPLLSPVQLYDKCLVIMQKAGEKNDTGTCSLSVLKKKYKNNPEIARDLKNLESEAWGGPNRRTWITFYGFTGELGDKRYKYVDESTAQLSENSMASWSASMYVGAAFKNHSVMSFEIKRQSSYKEGDVSTVCDLSGSATIAFCNTAALNAPVKSYKTIVSLNYRHLFGSVAISPTISYDMTNALFGIDVPIYMFQNENTNFTGGIRLGWTDENNESTAAIFVGNKFTFF